MRDFVRGHPDYQHDSKITDSIQYDLLQEVKNVNEDLSMAEKRVQDLLKFWEWAETQLDAIYSIA